MSETREEGEYEFELDVEVALSGLEAVRRFAGLEGDGLVVLRYEGDAVTVAGRLVTDHVWGGMERFFLVDPDA
jgi:hypothetical protein